MATPNGLLTVDAVTQTFNLDDGGLYVALQGVTLDVRAGEFITLIGHSGCGKSTLLNLMAGLSQASEGGILMNGRQVTEPGPDRMVVFQNYSLLPWLTVRQNIALAVDTVYSQLSVGERREIVERNIQLVNLSAAAQKLPAELSGGMKQRVAIARALAIRPTLLLLDEPTAGMSKSETTRFVRLIRDVTEGKTLLTVEHDMGVVFGLADKIAVLVYGEVIAFDTPERVRADARVQEAYLGSVLAEQQAAAAGA